MLIHANQGTYESGPGQSMNAANRVSVADYEGLLRGTRRAGGIVQTVSAQLARRPIAW